MAKRKQKYRRNKREIIAKQSASSRKQKIKLSINGRIKNIYDNYIDFLKALDTKDIFKKKAQYINIKSKEWNDLRKYRITASHVKRIYKWKRNSTYIYDKLTRNIEKYFKTRDDRVEILVLSILRESEYEIRYSGKVWIHRDFPGISGTTDDVKIKTIR